MISEIVRNVLLTRFTCYVQSVLSAAYHSVQNTDISRRIPLRLKRINTAEMHSVQQFGLLTMTTERSHLVVISTDTNTELVFIGLCVK